jgi:hypothetical protein
VEVPLTAVVSVRPEISYTNGGGMLTQDLTSSYVRREAYELQELRIPVLFQIGTSARNTTRGYLAIGGYAGYILDARMREQIVATGTGLVTVETPWSTVDGLVPVNGGAVLEVGLRTRFAGLNIGADVRLTHGLSSIGSGSVHVVQRDVTISFGIGIP